MITHDQKDLWWNVCLVLLDRSWGCQEGTAVYCCVVECLPGFGRSVLGVSGGHLVIDDPASALKPADPSPHCVGIGRVCSVDLHLVVSQSDNGSASYFTPEFNHPYCICPTSMINFVQGVTTLSIAYIDMQLTDENFQNMCTRAQSSYGAIFNAFDWRI